MEILIRFSYLKSLEEDPLKLVSASYKGTYEDCSGISYGDPNQGFDDYEWSDPDYEKYLRKLEQKEGIDI